MKKILLTLLLTPLLALAQGGGSEEAILAQAVDKIVAKDHQAAIELLQPLALVANPREDAFYYLGSAYTGAGDHRKAAATFADGASKFPLSARLHNAAAKAYEELFDLGMAVRYYRRTLALDPVVFYTGGGRYDAEFDAIYIPAVHDHRGMNSCGGRIYINDEEMHYVVYYVASGRGPGRDDSFRLPLDNLTFVEVDRKKGKQLADYSIMTMLFNLSGPRRRIAAGEQTRVDLKFVPEGGIHGYRGKPWKKKDIKFFFIEPEMGEKLVAYLKKRGIRVEKRK